MKRCAVGSLHACWSKQPCYPLTFTLVQHNYGLQWSDGAIELTQGGEDYGLLRGSTNC